MVGEILWPSTYHVVDYPHTEPSLEEKVNYVTANESSAAGDDGERLHDLAFMPP
jgi:hypothetical protein